MAKPISNEVKIAILVLATLALFFFGYNFLKGQDLFSSENSFYSIVDDASGISTTTDIKLRGVDVGKVISKQLVNNNSQVKITYQIDENIKVPSNSNISISSGIPGFGSTSIKLNLGNSSEFLAKNSEIPNTASGDLMGDVEKATAQLTPTIENLNKTLTTLDSIALNVNTLVSGNNGKNLENSIANLRATMANLNKTSKQVNTLMETESVKISSMLTNAESITANINNNKEALNKIIANLGTTSENFASLDVKNTLDKANNALAQLNTTLETINTGNGSLTLLLKDDQLYNNLNNTAIDLDRLVLDLKNNPRNYIPNISLIGGGNKEKKRKKKQELVEQ